MPSEERASLLPFAMVGGLIGFSIAGSSPGGLSAFQGFIIGFLVVVGLVITIVVATTP